MIFIIISTNITFRLVHHIINKRLRVNCFSKYINFIIIMNDVAMIIYNLIIDLNKSMFD